MTSARPESPRILVDADACPVKPEILKVAERHGLAVVFVANSGLRPSRDPMVSNVIVSGAFDAADNWIADSVKPDDIVVTADVPLAVRVVAAGAHVTGPTGRVFDARNIGMHRPCAISASTCARRARARATMRLSRHATARPFLKRSTGFAGGQRPPHRAAEAFSGTGLWAIASSGNARSSVETCTNTKRKSMSAVRRRTDQIQTSAMMNILLIALGGALGSVCRYLTGLAALRLAGPGFPWGTLAVNVVGGLAIGILAELVARKFDASEALRLLLVTGFLGGFTTFSAFSLEVAGMMERGALATAALYVASSVALSIAAVFAGLALVRGFV